MIYKIDKLENEGKVKITVKFTKEEFNKALEKHKGENQQASINEAINELIGKSYVQIIEHDKIEVAGYPSVALSNEIDEEHPFAYVVEVEVAQPVKLNQYTGFNIKLEAAPITQEEINAEIANSLSSLTTTKTVEGPLKEGQIAIIDFIGRDNGVAFEGGTGSNYSLEIGSNTFVPGFESQMIGMSVNETRFIDITFPTNYVAELAGKAVVFEVKVHEIKEKVLPELTDELISSLKIEGVTTVEAYRSYILNKMVEVRKQRAYDKAVAEMYSKLKEANPVKIPTQYVAEYVENQLSRIQAQAEQYKMPVEVLLQYSGFESIDAFKKQYSQVAINHLHEQSIIREVVMKENINVSKEEVEQYYEILSKQRNVEVGIVKEQYKEELIVESVLMEKGNKFLIANNIVK